MDLFIIIDSFTDGVLISCLKLKGFLYFVSASSSNSDLWFLKISVAFIASGLSKNTGCSGNFHCFISLFIEYRNSCVLSTAKDGINIFHHFFCA